MNRRTKGRAFLAACLVVAAGYATPALAGESGRVENVTGGEAVLQVKDATPGQAFEVYRNKRIMYGNPSKQPIPTYRRQTVGCVQVTEVVDAGHAKATVMHGTVEARDLTQSSGTSCPLPDKG